MKKLSTLYNSIRLSFWMLIVIVLLFVDAFMSSLTKETKAKHAHNSGLQVGKIV